MHLKYLWNMKHASIKLSLNVTHLGRHGRRIASIRETLKAQALWLSDIPTGAPRQGTGRNCGPQRLARLVAPGERTGGLGRRGQKAYFQDTTSLQNCLDFLFVWFTFVFINKVSPFSVPYVLFFFLSLIIFLHSHLLVHLKKFTCGKIHITKLPSSPF